MTSPAPECPRTIFFDLDGTLADTAPDLAFALNQLRLEEGSLALPFDLIRLHISDGTPALIQLGFGVDDGADPRYQQLRKRFLEIYKAHLARETRLFPGMAQVLDEIEARGLRWGIVTNKLEGMTTPLLKAMDLWERAVCVVSGDTTPNRKPHPEPLLHAAQQAGTPPHQCIYVGDSRNDIIAGREAGMTTLVALYGYIDPAQDPLQWGAHGAISQPLDLLNWLISPESQPDPQPPKRIRRHVIG
jgi:phosphoglycolate phosphatase